MKDAQTVHQYADIGLGFYIESQQWRIKPNGEEHGKSHGRGYSGRKASGLGLAHGP